MRSVVIGVALSAVSSWSLGACSDSTEPGASPTCTGARLAGEPRTRFGGGRPVDVLVSDRYDPTCPTPLMLILHGYGAGRLTQQIYFDGYGLTEDHALIVASPSGTVDQRGNVFWRMDPDQCCSFFNEVDDVAYLTGLIDEIGGEFNVDADRIYVVGHSNGGFMSYRLACEVGDKLAAVVSLAGASQLDLAGCTAAPTSVLQIHGTRDDTVRYDGGTDLIGGGGGEYPSATDTARLWAAHNRCGAQRSEIGHLDFDGDLSRDETRAERHADGVGEVVVELWTIEGGDHIPEITTEGQRGIWAWLSPLSRVRVSP